MEFLTVREFRNDSKKVCVAGGFFDTSKKRTFLAWMRLLFFASGIFIAPVFTE